MKPIIQDFLLLSRDAIHIHIGFACLALMIMCTSKKLSSFYILLPGLIVSLIMELFDLRDDYSTRNTLNILASLHDLVNTNFIPVVLVVLAKMKKVRV